MLEVAAVAGGEKEVLRTVAGRRWIFDLERDPGELRSLVDERSRASERLAAWLASVETGLARSDELPPPALTDEDLAALEDLGYLD